MAVLTYQQLHFILFPFMAQGHMIPMIDIAKLLSHRGVRVTVLLTPHNAARVGPVVSRAQESGLPVQVHLLDFPCAEAGLPSGCENFDLLPSFDLAMKFFDATKMLRPQVERLLREGLKPSPSCIIADMCFPWATDLARELHIPRIVFHGMCCFSLLCEHNLVRWPELEKVESDSEYFEVPGVPDKIEMTKAQVTHMVNPRSKEWSELCGEIIEAEENAYGILVNSFEELEPEYIKEFKKAKGKYVWTIGPVSLCNKVGPDKGERGNKASIDLDQCLNWLNSMGPASVLFVCLGSLSRLPTPQMVELGLALKASKRPFIWVIRHLSKEFQDFLEQEKYEEGVKGQGLIIHGWSPQVLILSHPSVGAFMTHCGWNSTLEGIASGVPLLTLPLFAEQFLNEKLAVNVLKVGVRVGMESPIVFGEEEMAGVQVSRDKIVAAVEEAFGGGREGEMRRKRAKALREAARRAVEEGGSSHLNMAKLIQDVGEETKALKSSA
ncbi:unnamed protein product [Cuscuta campestris]|uniref:Glycosyltransferase n=1 Tax=Cuscuta campestris TaxID=132261 RepID=A0A484NNC0_9ASTE|nr:unnamed protein product [Cuscuta campestris]